MRADSAQRVLRGHGAAWLLWALVASPIAARAQPVVRVRAEARIELRAEHVGGTIVVQGSLVDDLGRPLARRPVVVGVHEPQGPTLRSERRVTDAEGAFELRVPGEPTTYVLTARYEGDEYHPRLSVERRADLTRVPTRLRLRTGDGRVDLDAESHAIGIEARTALGGEGLALTLADELGRPLGEGTTDADGRLTLTIAGSALGEPGAGRLVASTPGDDARAEARVEAPIVRYRQADLSLEASSTSVSPAGELTLRGALTTSAGPSAGEAIGLFAGDEHLDTALTGADGRFEATIAAGDLPAGSVPLVARFESDGPGSPPAESEAIWVEVRRAAQTVWAWLALPLTLSLLVLLWLRRRAPPPEAQAPPEPEPVGVIQKTTAPRRGPPRLRVAGRMLDAAGDPLEGTLTARGNDGEERKAPCDPSGAFALELAEGPWRLEFGAPRHAPIRLDVELPHRGDLEGLKVRLETWRARALAVLRKAFTRRGESLDRWRKTTVHSLRDDPSLGSTAIEVEVSYYGPHEPDAGRIEELGGESAEPR